MPQQIHTHTHAHTHTHTHAHAHTGLAVQCFDCAGGACWEADWSCVNRGGQGCVFNVMTNPLRREWSEVRQVGLSRVLRRGHLCSQTLPFWSKAAFWVQSGGLTLGQLLNPNPWGGVRRHERFAVGRRWFRNAERFGRCGPRGVGRFQLRRKVCLRRSLGCK